MKSLILTATLASALYSFALPAQAGFASATGFDIETLMDSAIDKRRKPRVPGGSGCDDPQDIKEHPECRV